QRLGVEHLQALLPRPISAAKAQGPKDTSGNTQSRLEAIFKLEKPNGAIGDGHLPAAAEAPSVGEGLREPGVQSIPLALSEPVSAPKPILKRTEHFLAGP